MMLCGIVGIAVMLGYNAVSIFTSSHPGGSFALALIDTLSLFAAVMLVKSERARLRSRSRYYR